MQLRSSPRADIAGVCKVFVTKIIGSPLPTKCYLDEIFLCLQGVVHIHNIIAPIPLELLSLAVSPQ